MEFDCSHNSSSRNWFLCRMISKVLKLCTFIKMCLVTNYTKVQMNRKRALAAETWNMSRFPFFPFISETAGPSKAMAMYKNEAYAIFYNKNLISHFPICQFSCNIALKLSQIFRPCGTVAATLK